MNATERKPRGPNKKHRNLKDGVGFMGGYGPTKEPPPLPPEGYPREVRNPYRVDAQGNLLIDRRIKIVMWIGPFEAGEEPQVGGYSATLEREGGVWIARYGLPEGADTDFALTYMEEWLLGGMDWLEECYREASDMARSIKAGRVA